MHPLMIDDMYERHAEAESQEAEACANEMVDAADQYQDHLRSEALKAAQHLLGTRALYVALLKTEPDAHPDVRAGWKQQIADIDDRLAA